MNAVKAAIETAANAHDVTDAAATAVLREPREKGMTSYRATLWHEHRPGYAVCVRDVGLFEAERGSDALTAAIAAGQAAQRPGETLVVAAESRR